MAKNERKKTGREVSEKEMAVRKDRADRVLRLRKVLRLTRDYFQKTHSISPAAMQSWEDNKYGGMPESGAYTLSAAYQAEGIPVTVEWLMYGIGNDPLEGLVVAGYSHKKTNNEVEEFPQPSSSIAQELKVFYENNKNAVHLAVDDEGLSPWIMPGDYVAGQWLFDGNIKAALDLPCIVEIESGKKVVRIIRAGSHDNTYDIVCTNEKISSNVLKDSKLLAVAPITRIWKIKLTGKF